MTNSFFIYNGRKEGKPVQVKQFVMNGYVSFSFTDGNVFYVSPKIDVNSFNKGATYNTYTSLCRNQPYDRLTVNLSRNELLNGCNCLDWNGVECELQENPRRLQVGFVDFNYPFVRRALEALNESLSIAFKVVLTTSPDVTVYSCPPQDDGTVGETDIEHRRWIRIYGFPSEEEVLSTLIHEMGHALNLRHSFAEGKADYKCPNNSAMSYCDTAMNFAPLELEYLCLGRDNKVYPGTELTDGVCEYNNPNLSCATCNPKGGNSGKLELVNEARRYRSRYAYNPR